MVLKYPEYSRHSAAFVQAVQTLHTAAAQRDLDKTPKAYVAVTLQCVACHRYLARARIAE
jgi:cytochrome c556